MTKQQVIDILESYKPSGNIYNGYNSIEEKIDERICYLIDEIIESVKREPDDEGAVNMAIKGYKAFDRNWCCRGYTYEIGKTYTHNGEIKLCSAGFHFCEKLIDCFEHYPFNKETKVAEILARGDVISNGKKSVTNIIEIVRELTWSEVLNMVNLGIGNNGRSNIGNSNTGHYNTGNANTGDHNNGNSNTGDFNAGFYNTGNFNTGDYNTGVRNNGDYNTGMWNRTSYSSGYFNTYEPPLIVFNQPVNITRDDFLNLLGVRLLYNYVYKYRMDTTKAQIWYDALSPQNKQAIKDIPNFNAEIFKQITGIDVEYSN